VELLLGREAPLQEAIGVIVDHPLDPINLHDIDAMSEDAHGR
jgi:hypothetical protein